VIDAEALRHFPFFASFPAAQLARVAARLPVVAAPANSTVFAMDEASATMYLILAGQVTIHLVTTALKGRLVARSVVGHGTEIEVIFRRVIPD
jgi:CRP-like cAMP-binding protein